MNNVNAVDQVLRFPEVHRLTGLARSTVHALAAQGKFPKPIKLSANGRSSGWLQSELNSWMQSRLSERDSA